MTGQLRSALIAGLISAVIWMMITVLLGMDKGAVVGGGLAFLVGTALITLAISTVIASRVNRNGATA